MKGRSICWVLIMYLYLFIGYLINILYFSVWFKYCARLPAAQCSMNVMYNSHCYTWSVQSPITNKWQQKKSRHRTKLRFKAIFWSFIKKRKELLLNFGFKPKATFHFKCIDGLFIQHFYTLTLTLLQHDFLTPKRTGLP